MPDESAIKWRDGNMMKFVPTMNFNGQCREAMEMYAKAFGGVVTALLTYAESGRAGC